MGSPRLRADAADGVSGPADAGDREDRDVVSDAYRPLTACRSAAQQ